VLNEQRELILGRVRSALADSGEAMPTGGPMASAAARSAGMPAGTPGALAERTAADTGDADDRALLAAFTNEVHRLHGCVRTIGNRAELDAALGDLVRSERIRAAQLWQTEDLDRLGVAATLAACGVVIVPPDAAVGEVAACELGVTGADALLPETGSLLLRFDAGRPRTASLLPGIHLAIAWPSALRRGLGQALGEAGGRGPFVLITGPSRTNDIELTVTVGVHGPAALHVWLMDLSKEEK